MDINICFLCGKIVSQPKFLFYYNSKKHVSKISFWVKINDGFISSNDQKKSFVNVLAFDEKADLIYRNFVIYNTIKFEGILRNNFVELKKLL